MSYVLVTECSKTLVIRPLRCRKGRQGIFSKSSTNPADERSAIPNKNRCRKCICDFCASIRMSGLHALLLKELAKLDCAGKVVADACQPCKFGRFFMFEMYKRMGGHQCVFLGLSWAKHKLSFGPTEVFLHHASSRASTTNCRTRTPLTATTARTRKPCSASSRTRWWYSSPSV